MSNEKKPSRKWRVLRKLISILLTTILSIVLICLITGTIVASAVAVYILDFMDEASTITLEEMELSYNTNIYGYDKDGELETLYQVTNQVQRIPITNIEEVPQYVIDAFVYTEDERFYAHDGVDYKNTIAACMNMVLHFWDSERGGSTITQQLIKNVTGEDTRSPSRKIREIFRAMTLEKNYSKQDIIKNYLNYIGFGGEANGIEMAAIKYFGKNTKDLTIAEASVLAAIPQSPETLNPFAGYRDEYTGEWVNTGRKKNRDRQEYVLWQMYDHGAISYDEYQEALNEHIIYTDTDEYKKLHPELEAKDYDYSQKVTSWVVDAAILEVEDYLMDTYALDRDEALDKLNTGGYQIYVTIDEEMQEYVEDKYSSLSNIINTSNSARYKDTNEDGVIDDRDEVIYPQSAFVAMNYEGEILACVGAVGEKTDSLVWNFATQETRQPGSTIKPVAGYGYGIYSDEFHWGSKLQDSGLEMPDGSLWPHNYSLDSGTANYSYNNVCVYYGLMRSLNTISARLVDTLTTDEVFRFSTENMGLKLTELDPQGHSDKALSPLSVGALTYGVTVENMVNAYLPYGNGGKYYQAHIVSKLEQGNHELVYENDGHPHDAVDPETAYVMNRMMKNVVSSAGTAGQAQLKNKEVVGKTGTTENWDDLWFIGLTEDFASGIWIGYKNREMLDTSISSAKMWYNVIGEYADAIESGNKYPECETVVSGPVCANTGLMAGTYCPKGDVGYWKSTNAPVCTKCSTYSSRSNRNYNYGN